MSTLRFRHLRLRAETAHGRFGADIPFADGLMVLRADNSRGKSTAVKSLLFALGLERMITAKPTHSLTSAMRDRLIYDPATKRETPVLSSWVSVEIEGINGQSATLTRWAKHERFDPGLVRVVNGLQFSRPGEYESTDYYVGRAGAVANPRGFHRWLASFIGWDLPELPGADGRMVPLYMEQVFPLLFVEQRRGWGGIQAQMPYFSGVTDVRRRSTEFLLDLDVGRLESDRLRLRARESALQASWRTTVRTFNESIRGRGMITVGVPESLATTWPPIDPPTLATSQGLQWVSLDEAAAQLRAELAELFASGAKQVSAEEPEVEMRLRDALQESDSLRDVSNLLREEVLRDQAELRSVDERVTALTEDLRQHQDIATLERLGSVDLDELHQDCPVCHQKMPESLLGIGSPVRTLSTADTVNYIKQQIELFQVMQLDTQRALNAKRERLAAILQRSSELRSDVRAMRTTLSAAIGTPSTESIARRVHIEDDIERLASISERFLGLLGELDRLATEGRTVKAALSELPRDRLSGQDRMKLSSLQQSFLDQLREYDFGSFSDERLQISEIDYLPRREEFDLQADISASDSVRVIWAYLIGLMEVSFVAPANHPGVLIFDEPRQQSAKEVSFKALLKRAAGERGRSQVIFATSEDLVSLRSMLAGLNHSLCEVEGYLLKPVQE